MKHVCCGCGGLCDSQEPCPMREWCRCKADLRANEWGDEGRYYSARSSSARWGIEIVTDRSIRNEWRTYGRVLPHPGAE